MSVIASSVALTGHGSAQREACAGATVPTTDPMRTGLGSNQGLSGEGARKVSTEL